MTKWTSKEEMAVWARANFYAGRLAEMVAEGADIDDMAGYLVDDMVAADAGICEDTPEWDWACEIATEMIEEQLEDEEEDN